jgi:hypothetical protein
MNVGSLDSVKAMAQEAMETAAQTKAEAAKGDQQAVQKLAREQAANNAQSAQKPTESAEGRLNVIA